MRFVVRHGIRDIKDTVSRDILKAFDAADISIATTAYNSGGFPRYALKMVSAHRKREDGENTAY